MVARKVLSQNARGTRTSYYTKVFMRTNTRVVHQKDREVVPRVDPQARDARFSYLASLPIVSLKATFGLPEITGQLYSVRILY